MSRPPRPCPLCGAAARVALHRNGLAPLDDLDLSYELVRCVACAMVFGDRLPPEADYARYYAEYSKYDVAPSVADVPRLTATMADAAAAFVAPYLAADARVLDIGCAIGAFLGALKRRGFARVEGLDPAPQAPAAARRLFDVEVATGFLTAGFDAAEYDLVALIAVLEHLVDPAAALAPIAATLPVGGLLYLEVPAGDRFDRLRGEWLGELSHEHVNFFGQASLTALAARLGLAPVACEHPTYVNGQIGLRALFRREARPIVAAPVADVALAASVDAYLAAGRRELARLEAVIAPFHGRRVIVYGAGAHTARLLAQSSLGRCDIACVADRNPNLVGKRLGDLPIVDPAAIASYPDVPVLISSYQAQAAIRGALARDVANPLHVMYGRAPAAPVAG